MTVTIAKDGYPEQPGIYRVVDIHCPIMVCPDWHTRRAYYLDVMNGTFSSIVLQNLPKEPQWEALWLQS